jgi:DNA-binding NtrC family response regulator
VSDARLDRRYRAEDALEGKKPPQSVWVFPLVVKGEVVGGVYLDHRFQKLDGEDGRAQSFTAMVDLCGLILHAHDQRARLRGLERESRSLRRRCSEASTGSGPARTPDGPTAAEHGVSATGDETLPHDASRPELRQTVRLRSADLVEFHGLKSANPDMLDLFDTVRGLRDSDLPVLICGETGTGKSVLARAVHAASRRADQPFVVLSCGAIPDSLAESEILGHVRGAFTGAERDNAGLFAQAHGGTLVLDEIADMSDELQKKLLRVIEDGKVRPLGAKEAVVVDVRIVSCTSGDLDGLVAQGRVRQDLYYRLKGVVLEVPALRDRWEDVPPLAALFLRQHSPGATSPELTSSALSLFTRYSWPGNVRELENEMRRLATLRLDTVRVEDLAPALRRLRSNRQPRSLRDESSRTLEEVVQEAECRAIVEVLRHSGGNKSLAARTLGITRKALYRKLERYGVGPAAADEPPAGGPVTPSSARGDDR